MHELSQNFVTNSGTEAVKSCRWITILHRALVFNRLDTDGKQTLYQTSETRVLTGSACSGARLARGGGHPAMPQRGVLPLLHHTTRHANMQSALTPATVKCSRPADLPRTSVAALLCSWGSVALVQLYLLHSSPTQQPFQNARTSPPYDTSPT